MTVSSATTTRVPYTASGSQTTFAYTWRIFADTDLEVYDDGVLQTHGTDYTVTGAGDAGGGNVVFTSAPAATSVIVILSAIPAQQAADLVANQAFDSDAIETELDRQALLIKQLEEKLDRVAMLAASSLTTGLVLGEPEANKVLAINSDGDEIEYLDAADLDSSIAETNTTTGYARASLPTVVGGQIVRTTDDARGLWLGTSTQWFNITGEVRNVQEFGAKGDGPTTDDTAAFQAAHDSLPDEGGVIIVPPANTGAYYKLTDELTFTKSYHLKGSGMYPTIIQQTTAGKKCIINDATMDDNHSTSVYRSNVLISDIDFRATGVIPGICIDHAPATAQLRMERVRIYDWDANAVKFQTTSRGSINQCQFRKVGWTSGAYAVHLAGAESDDIAITHTSFTGCGGGIKMDGSGTNNVLVFDCRFDTGAAGPDAPGAPHIQINGCQDIRLIANQISTQANDQDGIEINQDTSGSPAVDPGEILIWGNTIRAQGAYGIDVAYGDNIIIDANRFGGNTSGSIQVQSTCTQDGIYIGPLNYSSDTPIITDGSAGTVGKAVSFKSQCRRFLMQSDNRMMLDLKDTRAATYHWRLQVDGNQQLLFFHVNTSQTTPAAKIGATSILPGTSGNTLGSATLQWAPFIQVVATASLPAPGAAQNGKMLIEDGGAGNQNLVVYANDEMYRFDGGSPAA